MIQLNTLPPATMVGANTFGCLIDGKVFLPDKNPFSTSVILQCNYEFIDSEYYLILAARNYIDNYSVSINMNLINQIASGTFWFDAIDSTTGKIVQIREGRFDVQFTQ